MNKLLPFVFSLLLMLPGWVVLGQPELDQTDEIPRDPKAREKIEAARIGMITNRLALTPEQAEKFWPVYRDFSEKRRDLRMEFKKEQQRINPQTATPEQQKKLLDLDMHLKQKELDLEKAYSAKLLNVITADQLLSLRNAERDFQRMLINQLQRRDMQHRRENFREKHQQRDKRN